MNLLEKIKNEVPKNPGCYIFYNDEKEVIYVGKAKNLKNRMSSYFNRSVDTKTQHLVNKIKSFDYYITNNEKEALILENNLIKKYNPFYNIILKDDKTYPYIFISKEINPIIKKVRLRNLKGTYYGPFPSSSLVNQIIKYLNKKIPLRKCNTIPKEECIYYHINQCYAPCIKEVDEDQIKEYKKQVNDYLKNGLYKLTKELKVDMQKAADSQNFEKAQEYKDMLDMIQKMNDEQNVQFPNDINFDYIDYYKDDNFISIAILKIQDGKLTNIHRSLFPYYEDIFEDLSSYLYDYYQKSPPAFATTDEQIKNIMYNLLLVKEQNLDLKKHQSLNSIAIENAKEYYQKNINRITKEFFKSKSEGYEELQKLTKDKLKRIEMIDISHIGGDAQVGGVIVYTNGKKDKKEYRKYKIKDLKNIQDDYGSIKEILRRRFKRSIKDGILPDLLIIDGGKGQVSSALEVLKEFNLENKIKLIGLSKDNKHKTKGIVNKNLDEKIIKRDSKLYKFLYDLQEEVHRYAIDFHRQVKVKSLFQSELDQISGIGQKRKQLLIDHFQYVDNIKKATKEELKKLKLSDQVVDNIYEHFKNSK